LKFESEVSNSVHGIVIPEETATTITVLIHSQKPKPATFIVNSKLRRKPFKGKF
jgi:hypothetical protein